MPVVNNALDPWLPDDPVPLTRDAVPVAVYRVNGSTLEPMDSLRCLSVNAREGPVPRAAAFRYAFDGVDPDSPQDAEQALDVSYTLPKIVKVGDRLAVKAFKPDGTFEWIFDGYPYTFSVQINAGTEEVVILAMGREQRAWDLPVGGALFRQSDDPETVDDVETDLVIRFNPQGEPNASPSTADAGVTGYKYPTQMDPSRTGVDTASVDYPRTFDLPMAVAHVLYRFNDGVHVTNPTRAALDALLVSREPISGTPYDPTNSSTYDAKPIQAPDTPLSDRSWPGVVHDLVRGYGFGMRFPITTVAGLPEEAVELYLRPGGTVKSLYLPAFGSDLDPARCNVGEAQLSRDLTPVVNQWTVHGALKRYEASFILAPAFQSASADAASADAIAAFDLDEADPTAVAADKYRVWALAEGGDTSYTNSGTASTVATSLDNVLGAGTYVRRRRAPIGKLVTADDNGRPLKAKLSISRAYANGYPDVWDGTGTDWQDVEGGWQLLPDRVGVRITAKSPNDWKIGKSDATGAPYPLGVVKALESIAAPNTENPVFYLRLTCVIEGDQAVKYTAAVSPTAAITYPLERVIDARDRIHHWTVAKHSQFNNTTSAVVERDDTNYAKSEAIACRTDSDNGVFEGTVVIPRFTAHYGIGDRIDQLSGRNLGLRTDNGGTDYAPVYPSVVAVTWDLEGGQRTTLHLSDAGLDRARKGVKQPSGYGDGSKLGEQDKARQVAALAAQIQQAGFGVKL